jgi:hypothetical protein
MTTFAASDYQKLLSMHLIKPVNKITCIDHLGGFTASLENAILQKVSRLATDCGRPIEFHNSYLFDDRMQKKYPELQFSHYVFEGLRAFENYNMHPPQTFSKFLCSFNHSDHVSRKFLVAVLARFGWFDATTCSKHFQFTSDKIDGHLAEYLGQQHQFYRKFFMDKTSAEFFESTNGFGCVKYDHAHNMHNLECQLTSSFLHVVSETLATSYYPFVTEKFLYSVVTRGLFLAYAQPGWHDHLERYYGFRRYDRIFDYRFDAIQNPVERLVELMSMIAKFSVLSSDDWRDLHEMESETIEYNYEHYFSGRYMRHLREI